MARNIDLVMDKINKQMGEIICKEGVELEHVEKIPFSSPTANYMTYGGVPRGKAVEFFGSEGGGKTTTALDVAGNAQKLYKREYQEQVDELNQKIDELKPKAGKRDIDNKIKKIQTQLDELQAQGAQLVAYLDLEQTLDEEWAKQLGVNLDELILIRPQSQTAEQMLQITMDLMDTGNVGLVVLDSIPCLVPQVIFDETMEKKSYGGVAGPLAVFSGKVVPHMNKHKTTLIMINQEREDLSSPYSTYSTPGGRAVKHLYSLRIRFRKGSLLDENNREVPSKTENPAGNIVQTEIIKTKVCKPNRRIGHYTLNYLKGIDAIADTIELALRFQYIVQAGAWFTFMDPETGEIICDEDGNDLKFQGMSKLLAYLQSDEIMLEELKSRLHDALTQE